MAAPKIDVLDLAGRKVADITLAEDIFGPDVKPHLLHETVRAEAAASRAGTRAAKGRALVSGGRSKPWRQKGTGRARAGTTRAPQWTGGGVAFPPQPRSHAVKVNRKVRKASLRAALTGHVERSSLAVVDAASFAAPSTKSADRFLHLWGAELPVLVIAQPEEASFSKSFRNLDGVLVLEPSELDVGALVWARSVLTSQAALEGVQEMAS